MSQGLVISGQVIGAEQVVARFQKAGPQVRARVREEVQRLGLELLRKVKDERLTGQALRVRSGRLRRSINHRFTEQGNDLTSSVGTNVVYGRFWELGFNGVEKIREHVRTVRQAFGRPIAPTQSVVQAHTRNVNQAARPFLRPSLEAMKADIRARLITATQGGL